MTELSKEYGEGLYALAAEEQLSQELLAQMEMLAHSFREEPAFLHLLSNMSLSKEERLGILENTFRGQIHPYVLNFLKILCERGAMMEFAACAKAYRALYNQEHHVLEAKVTTGAKMTDDQRARLIEKLQKMTGKEIQLSELVDEKVIGGVLLEMDGKRYDNTVRHRLSQIHQAMTGEA